MDNTKMILDESFVKELCKTNYKLGIMHERMIFVMSVSAFLYTCHCYKRYKDSKTEKTGW